jgi:hypothetical protein
MDRRYLVAVGLLAVLAVAFGVFGTVAPPLAEEGGVEPQQESSSESVGHFQNPPTYDSGWVDISGNLGQSITLTHDLNTSEVLVDVTGRQTLSGADHKLFFGATSQIPGLNVTYGGSGIDERANSVVQTSDGGYAFAGRQAYDARGYDLSLVKVNASGAKQWGILAGAAHDEEAYSLVQTSDGGYALAGYQRTGIGGAGASDLWLVKRTAAGGAQWGKAIGGAGYEYGFSLVQTGDGGYSVAGSTSSYGAGSTDFWLVRTDSSGNVQWNKTYGGANADTAHSVVQTGDGGYALAGYTNSFGAGNYDFWLVKTDSAGNVLWSKTYGGTNADFALSVVQAGDGGYALAGYTSSYGAGSTDFWLVRTDSSGNVQWNKTYGGISTDYAFSVVQTGDGGYALAGYTNSYGAGYTDFWLVKTDSAGNMQWNKTYGGGASYDFAQSSALTSDGGYVLAGYTYPYGSSNNADALLVKTDSAGNAQWSKIYTTPSDEVGRSMIQTVDGGYALAGYIASPIGYGNDFLLAKISSAGNMQWYETYASSAYDECAYSLIQTFDGGYVLAGYVSSRADDFWLVKTDSRGVLELDLVFGGNYDDRAYSLIQTNDGGYALTGYARSYSGGTHDAHFWLVKTDSAGNVQLNKTYGGTGDDVAYSLIQTNDGGYALAGSTKSYGAGDTDFWLVRTDSAGNMLWSKTYGGTVDDVAYSLIQTSDGGYALAGSTKSYGAGNYDFWLVRTDSSGNMLWSKTYGGTSEDFAYSMIQTSDGGYALTGYTKSYGVGTPSYSNIWLIKTDRFGNAQWSKTYEGSNNDFAYSIIQTSDGGYALAGQTYSYGSGGSDVWLIKTDTESGSSAGLSMTELTNSTITLYHGSADPYWNYVRVRIWLIKEPTWIYGDINMDGIVDAKDLYIIGRNYGKTFSLLSLTGIVAVAGIRTVKKRKQAKTN